VTRSVVVGVDDSAAASSAAVLGATLAERLELRLVLVHVAAPAGVGGMPFRDPVVVALHNREKMEQLGPWLGALATALGIRPDSVRVETGRPSQRLAAVARQDGAALIVVGAPSARGGRRRSLTHKLVRAAPCPVVVAPEQMRSWRQGSRNGLLLGLRPAARGVEQPGELA